MSKTKTDADAAARKMLAAIPGINLDEGGIVQPVVAVGTSEAVLAPEGVDPRTIPATEIVFDPALLDGVDLSTGAARSAACKPIFALYQSPPRTNRDRNSVLNTRISDFVRRVHASRQTGVPHVKEAIRAAKPQRDLLAFLAEHDIKSVDDLTGLLRDAE